MGRTGFGGAAIDRSRTLRFTFDGRPMTGHPGDTLASALLANGARVVARSFKYHRPRGVVALGDDEPNALVQLDAGGRFDEPNTRATRVRLHDGLAASSQNRWPNLAVDIGALAWPLHRFLPAGFYYKTFKWPGWHTFEPFIRRAAGLGRAPVRPDPSSYLKRFAHCDVLVAGAGPAGLAAALQAARSGARVIVAHPGATPGGGTIGRPGVLLDGRPAARWVAETHEALRGHPDVTLLPDTTVLGVYDHGMVLAVEHLDAGRPPQADPSRPRQRLWHVRATRLVLATGAHERPMVFPDNDRPGVMLAGAVAGYACRYGVKAGHRAVVVTSADDAYAHAAVMLDAGIDVAAVIDVRPRAPGDAAEALAARGVAIHADTRVAAVRGARGVRDVTIARTDGSGRRRIDCDLVAMCGGSSPAVQLFAQSGGALRYDPAARAFVPDGASGPVTCVGRAAGRSAPQAVLDDARAAFAAGACAARPGPPVRPEPESPASVAAGAAWWNPSAPADRQWVDFQSDVTVADVRLAAHEGFESVEHLKRYTTIGMATDQGRTSNVNALALLGEVTGRTPGEVGTTRFRPPYVPVTMAAVAAGAHGDLFAPRRRLPANASHERLGSVFEDFGGWQRPDHYPRAGEARDEAVLREHGSVRHTVGLFDASPIGKIEVRGRDGARFLDFIYANRMDTLASGRIRYGLMLAETGNVIDDGVCARTGDGTWLVSPSSGAAARVAAWLDEWRQCEFLDWDVDVLDVTGAWASIAIAGPRARDALATLRTDIDLSPAAFPHMACRAGTLEGVPCRMLRVSYTGELQFEVQVPTDYGAALWDRLTDACGTLGGGPVGIESWLRLRVEKGYLHVGTDTDGTTLPADLGFGDAIARKPGDFVGRRSLTRPDGLRADREQFVGIRTLEPSTVVPVGAMLIPCATLPGAGARREGRVTSSCWSPTLGRGIALGLARAGRSRLGERLDAWFDGRAIPVELVEPTWYDPQGARLHV